MEIVIAILGGVVAVSLVLALYYISRKTHFLRGRVETMDTDLGDLKVTQGTQGDDLHSQQGELDNQQGDLHNHQGDLDTHQGELDSHQEQLDTQQGQLNVAVERIEQSAQRVDDFTDVIANDEP